MFQEIYQQVSGITRGFPLKYPRQGDILEEENIKKFAF